MYLIPEAKVSVESAGEHDIMVRLSDTEHCYYSTVAMTTVILTGGTDHGDTGDSGDEGTVAAPEETVIGFLEVLPR